MPYNVFKFCTGKVSRFVIIYTNVGTFFLHGWFPKPTWFIIYGMLIILGIMYIVCY